LRRETLKRRRNAKDTALIYSCLIGRCHMNRCQLACSSTFMPVSRSSSHGEEPVLVCVRTCRIMDISGTSHAALPISDAGTFLRGARAVGSLLKSPAMTNSSSANVSPSSLPLIQTSLSQEESSTKPGQREHQGEAYLCTPLGSCSTKLQFYRCSHLRTYRDYTTARRHRHLQQLVARVHASC
jgi:hypothetical protein